MGMKKIFTIRGIVQKYPGLGGWHFVRVSEKDTVQLKKIKKTGYGLIPIQARLGTSTWATSFLPGKEMYFVALKASVRKKENIKEGDKVSVTCRLL